MSPQFAFKGGPTPITITGSGFVATPKVFLEGAPAIDAGASDGGTSATQLAHAAFVSGTSMTAIVPADTFTSGTYALRVVNPNVAAGAEHI